MCKVELILSGDNKWSQCLYKEKNQSPINPSTPEVFFFHLTIARVKSTKSLLGLKGFNGEREVQFKSQVKTVDIQFEEITLSLPKLNTG